MTAEGELDRDTGRAAEQWLRRQGLPYFVPRKLWADRLFVRVAPFLVFLIVIDIGTSGILDALITVEVDDAAIAALLLVGLVIAAIALIITPFVLSYLAGVLLRRTPRAALPATIALLALCLAGIPLVTAIVVGPTSAMIGVVVNLVVIGLAYLLTWLGIGALLSWAARTALRQLAAIGALATRALPILMLVVVFAFFSRPLWEVTSTMSPARLLLVVLFFALLGVLFVVPITRTEMKELDQRIDPADRVRDVRSTGLTSLYERALRPGPAPRRSERANLESVFTLTLGFQVVFFALIVCVFLLVLGGLAFSSEVLEEWVGPRETTIEVFGVELPFTWALVKTAVFLSAVSSLNFLVSVTTNRAYRTAFYDPQFQRARTALSVRAAYLSHDDGPEATAITEEPDGSDGFDHEDDEPHPRHPGMIEPGMIEPGRGSE
ncbi:MAG: hypothetical protein EPO52_05145 [Herbiconiux sp.]|uniref:hypothetical protein n=1 Tax=Herbiconiux sp. TaxID=1871186 RepID=UPI001202FBA1|nr:hypothetical protein [Herbiconiux sp.]TAJ49176.1 MAG: hypothetical protein EPO52_05145 [Herbiconiux sp.]